MSTLSPDSLNSQLYSKGSAANGSNRSNYAPLSRATNIHMLAEDSSDSNVDDEIRKLRNTLSQVFGNGVIFKGIINSPSELPASGYKAGWQYYIATAGTYAGEVCEVGDFITCVNSFSGSFSDADWKVTQANINGAVVGPGSATIGNVAIFGDNLGFSLTDSGYTIETSVPPNAVFTDTTYEAATAIPQAPGIAAIGSSDKYAREDHVHPEQVDISGTAAHAIEADHATEADHALASDSALTAANAANAAHADEADHAANADRSLLAVSANEAAHAILADTATNAAEASHAGTADLATKASEADHATSSDTADYALDAAKAAECYGTAEFAKKLTTSVGMFISDATASNVGPQSSFDGSASVSLMLPTIIKVDIEGNATTADTATFDSDGNRITDKYVTLDTVQTITGDKKFTGSVKVPSLVLTDPMGGIVTEFPPDPNEEEPSWSWGARRLRTSRASSIYISYGALGKSASNPNYRFEVSATVGSVTKRILEAGLNMSNGKLYLLGITPDQDDNSDKLATTEWVQAAIADLVSSIPDILEALRKLSEAIGDDPNFAVTLATELAKKADDDAVVHKQGTEEIPGAKTFADVYSTATIPVDDKSNRLATTDWIQEFTGTLKATTSSSTHSTESDHSTNSDHATSADYATEAGHAETADQATMANSAIYAETAGSATTDSEGHNISEYYASNESITNIVNQITSGDIVSGCCTSLAEEISSVQDAIDAIQDAIDNGNIGGTIAIITYGTTALTSGVSPLASGSIYCQYEA